MPAPHAVTARRAATSERRDGPAPAEVLSDEALVRYLAADGVAQDVEPASVPDRDTLVDLLRKMILLRVLDERIVTYQRQGRCGTNPTYHGEEAVMAGSALAAGADDWLFPTYRQTVIGTVRGMDPAFAIRQFRGDQRGLWDPRPQRVGAVAHPIATHLPHAVGLTYAARLRGDSVAALAYIGDGGTSEGDTHEAMNLAALWGTPTIFLCTNNHWAISTPLSRQSSTPRLVERAIGYRMAAVRVDGFDVLAVHLACRDAFERAHRGEGPTFVEAVTYRLGPHATPDDPSRYRGEERAAEWRRLEPIARYRAWLERRGIYEDGMEEAMRAEARALADGAMQAIEADGPPEPAIMWSTLFAEPPAEWASSPEAQLEGSR